MCMSGPTRNALYAVALRDLTDFVPKQKYMRESKTQIQETCPTLTMTAALRLSRLEITERTCISLTARLQKLSKNAFNETPAVLPNNDHRNLQSAGRRAKLQNNFAMLILALTVEQFAALEQGIGRVWSDSHMDKLRQDAITAVSENHDRPRNSELQKISEITEDLLFDRYDIFKSMERLLTIWNTSRSASQRYEIFFSYSRHRIVPPEASEIWNKRNPLHDLNLQTAPQKMAELANFFLQFARECIEA